MHINKDESESLIYLANSLINDLELFKSQNNSKQYNITRDALNKLFSFMLEQNDFIHNAHNIME